MRLAAHQVAFCADIRSAWVHHQNVLGVMPTGGGKTFCFCTMAGDATHPGVIFAHRDVLLEQISLSLAKLGVYHDLFCSDKTRGLIRESHYDTYGRFFYKRNALVTVVGVDTAHARIKKGHLHPLAQKSRWWVMDEAHHILQANKWGRVLDLFGHCHGLGVTATPCRSDKRGLGRDNDGVFDALVTSVTMRDLIDAGRLCDYQILTSPLASSTSKQFRGVKTTAGGDYSPSQSKPILDSRTVIGDVVGTYKKHADNKRGITFGFDIEHCHHLSDAYKSAGVLSAALSSKTPDTERKRMLKAFRAGHIKQLVNCDLFGEGFDVPGVEVVSMARATMSYSLYVQQFGRALRIMSGKPHALIIDHVGNWQTHGLPDYGLNWTLDRPAKTKRTNNTNSEIKLTTCTNPGCLRVFELPAQCCPYCKNPIVTVNRGDVKNVDGELVPLTPVELNKLRIESLRLSKPPGVLRREMMNNGHHAAYANMLAKNHSKTHASQEKLRQTMQEWAALQYKKGLTPQQAAEQFTLIYGIDPLTAQTLKHRGAEILLQKIS